MVLKPSLRFVRCAERKFPKLYIHKVMKQPKLNNTQNKQNEGYNKNQRVNKYTKDQKNNRKDQRN